MIAESICHIGRCFLFAWRNPGFFYVYFQEVVTHGKPDQGDYGRDRRRYQRLEKSLAAVNNSIKKTQSQLRDVNNLLKLDPSNTILLAQKQELLQSAIGDTEKKLEALEQAQEDVAKAFERGDLGKDQYMAFQREVEETRGTLNRIRRIFPACSRSRSGWLLIRSV